MTGAAWDGSSVFFGTLVAVVVAALCSLAAAQPRSGGRRVQELVLLLFSAIGAIVTVVATDLVVLFGGLVLVTVPLYAATGGRGTRAVERAVPGFLLGATATATAGYGIALLYASTGQTAYAGLGRATANPLYLAGLALLCAGLVTHLALGSAARLSILRNVAIAAALIRLVAATRNGDVALDWEVTLATLGALALVVAGLGALTERRIGRLVGWALISQLGYSAIGVAGSAAPAAAFSLAVYAALGIGILAFVAVLPEADDPTLSDLAGLARRRPVLVVGLGVLVAGLIGIPPTAGFIARLSLFEAAVRGQLLWLVLVGALAAVVGAASYGRIVLACFAPPRLDAVAPPRARVATAVVLLAALAVLIVGVFPGPLLELVQTVRF